MRVEVFCPVCAAAGIRRKLMEVDSEARGVVYPYCKGCKKNVRVELPLRGDRRKNTLSNCPYRESGYLCKLNPPGQPCVTTLDYSACDHFPERDK